jgi:uncharacterized protein (UPF0548 family)
LASPTFDHVGATRSGSSIAGFRHDSYSGALGRGRADLQAGRDGLRAWAAHTGAGVSISPPTEPLAVGATVIGTTSVGPMHVLIPCRVVYIVDEDDRFGFAYATLPGHPECGEEAFVVALTGEDDVTFTISSHSRPAEFLARLGGPVSRFVQRRTNQAYLAALRAFVDRQRG